MTTFAENVYWLTLIQESGLRLTVLKPIILRWCVNEQRSLADLLELSPLELTTTFGLADADADRILAVKPKLAQQANLLARWQQTGIHPIIRTDAAYPRRLTFALAPAKQPLVLWLRGPAELLNRPGVTLLGQPGTEKAGDAFINNLLLTLEAESIGLISGYSRGLDRASFESMLATHSGFTVAMLPMGLAAFADTTSKLDAPVDAGRAALISPFAPDTPFDDRLADARNLLIDHLTLALLIPESDDESQLRAAAALERGLPVFVKEDTDMNRQLLDQGALLLTDAGEVIDWVQQAMLDDAMRETDEEEALLPPSDDLGAAPLTVTAPTTPTPSDEDYKLRTEDMPPIDSEEAIEILSLGGDIPDILRHRLKNRDDE